MTMEQKLKYTFTPEERALLERRFAAYLDAVKLIAELHNIQGNITVSVDMAGFVGAEVHAPTG